MNAGQLAAAIAAAFFAAGVCVAAYVLLKFARVATEAARYLAALRERSDLLIDRANAVVDLANAQLTTTDAITANMNEVSASVTELTERLSALARMGQAIAAGPLGKAASVAYGVRWAVGLRQARAIERSPR
jgi:uncharacterized protein YoxC